MQQYINLKGLLRRNEMGYKAKNLNTLNTLRVNCHLFEFYLMFLSQEIDLKLCQCFTKTDIYEMCYSNQSLKQICNKSDNKDSLEESQQLRNDSNII